MSYLTPTHMIQYLYHNRAHYTYVMSYHTPTHMIQYLYHNRAHYTYVMSYLTPIHMIYRNRALIISHIISHMIPSLLQCMSYNITHLVMS